jgi:hypothetical protein
VKSVGWLLFAVVISVRWLVFHAVMVLPVYLLIVVLSDAVTWDYLGLLLILAVVAGLLDFFRARTQGEATVFWGRHLARGAELRRRGIIS